MTRPLRTISKIELERLMPAVLRELPEDDLHNRTVGANPTLDWFRVSAFPKFATSFDELMEMLAVSPAAHAGFRRRFSNFIELLAVAEPCYSRFRRFAHTKRPVRIQAHRNELERLAIALSERDAADIRVPS